MRYIAARGLGYLSFSNLTAESHKQKPDTYFLIKNGFKEHKNPDKTKPTIQLREVRSRASSATLR